MMATRLKLMFSNQCMNLLPIDWQVVDLDLGGSMADQVQAWVHPGD